MWSKGEDKGKSKDKLNCNKIGKLDTWGGIAGTRTRAMAKTRTTATTNATARTKATTRIRSTARTRATAREAKAKVTRATCHRCGNKTHFARDCAVVAAQQVTETQSTTEAAPKATTQVTVAQSENFPIFGIQDFRAVGSKKGAMVLDSGAELHVGTEHFHEKDDISPEVPGKGLVGICGDALNYK